MTRPPGVMGSRVEAVQLGISGELTARGPGARPKLGEEWEGGREGGRINPHYAQVSHTDYIVPVLVELDGKVSHHLHGLVVDGHISVDLTSATDKGPQYLHSFAPGSGQPLLQYTHTHTVARDGANGMVFRLGEVVTPVHGQRQIEVHLLYRPVWGERWVLPGT